MGNYGTYFGNMNIPDESKEKFTRQIRTILNRGGMMDTEEVNIFGMKLTLLCPVDINAEGKTYCFYNYFEDDGWETACYDPESGYLNTEKIGNHEFNRVCMAAYQLYDHYTDEPGYIVEDGDINCYPAFMTGWLNYLLGEEFTLEKRKNLWDIAEKYVMAEMSNGDNACLTNNKLQRLIPEWYWKMSGGIDLADLMNIVNNEPYYERNEESYLKEGTYPYDVYQCKKAIDQLSRDDESWQDKIVVLAKMPVGERRSLSEGEGAYAKIAKSSLYLHARVLLYTMAQLIGKDTANDEYGSNELFWSLWKEHRADVYHDESVRVYASNELTEQRENAWKTPCEMIRTTDFLRLDPWVPNGYLPKEVRHLSKYFVSDDDRMYWWNGTDDVCISDEMDEWLKFLAIEWRNIVDTLEGNDNSSEFLQNFMQSLYDANNYYRHIYAFRDMFYEFVCNSSKKEYRAASELLRRLVDDEKNREAGKVIEKIGYRWEYYDRRATFNEGRLKLRRYLSVMANKKLRRKYFGF